MYRWTANLLIIFLLLAIGCDQSPDRGNTGKLDKIASFKVKIEYCTM